MIKKIADQFFRWYCDPDYYPDIKGDIEEIYLRNKEKSVKAANRQSVDTEALSLTEKTLGNRLHEAKYLASIDKTSNNATRYPLHPQREQSSP